LREAIIVREGEEAKRLSDTSNDPAERLVRSGDASDEQACQRAARFKRPAASGNGEVLSVTHANATAAKQAAGGDLAPYPRYEFDLFAPEALQAPFGHYRAIRDLGPVVRISHPEVLAISRYEDVKAALMSPQTLISGKGVGFNDTFNTVRTDPPIIQSDGEQHRAMRKLVFKNLSSSSLKSQRTILKAMIVERIREMLDAPQFDAVTELAQHLPVNAISKLVGLPEEGRSRMLLWAEANFNMVGPLDDEADLEKFKSDLDLLREALAYLQEIEPDEFPVDSWLAKLFAEAEQGIITVDQARSVARAYVLPSLDTTIFAISNLLFNLAQTPDQFELLKRRPELIPGAVFEGVRHSATVRWFSRVAASDYHAGDVHIREGSRVMIMYGAANRDERRYKDPDKFDVTRDARDQLGWGSGPHVCAGLHLARLEMEVLLEALVENVGRLEAGEPTFSDNRGLFGLKEFRFRMLRS
jgi:cytochrome P450